MVLFKPGVLQGRLRSIASAAERCFDFIFHSRCVGCNKECGAGLCELCLSSLPYNSDPYCFRCGKSLKLFNVAVPLCSECRQHKKRHAFVCARSVLRFEGIAREAVNALKFKRKKTLITVLGSLMCRFLEGEMNVFCSKGNYELTYELEKYEFPPVSTFDAVVPVPVHWVRFYTRGFNQSELLAREVSFCLGLKMLTDVLFKKKNTVSQTRISGSEAVELRKKNVKGTFFVRNNHLLSGKRVLLLDDVFTTGATVNECASVLLSSGAKAVYVLTLAS